MGIFVQDTFTGAAGTAVPAHAGEIGGWMTTAQAQAAKLDYPSYAAEDTAQLNGAGSAYKAANVDNHMTLVSNVVPSQLDVYFETTFNVGTVNGSYTPLLQIYVHEYQPAPYTSGASAVSLDIGSSNVFVTGPVWAVGSNPTLPGVANNAVMTLRLECHFSAGTTELFINGASVAVWSIDSRYITPGSYQNLTPKNIVVDLNASNVTGSSIAIDYFEAGTIDPPAAFWTDLTGSLAETLGA